MASFWLIKKILIVVLVCKLVVAFSVEPKYTKFQFEEQLLEKLIRFEIYFESIKKENSLLISEALDSINKTKQEMDKEITNLIDTKSEVKNALLEAQTSIKAEYDGLSGQINQLKTDMSEIKSKDETKVVFNVYSTSPQSVSGTQPVIFDQVRQNEGNGYDVSTGIFTAPVSGIYQFNGHLCANNDGDLEYGIVVNSGYIVAGEFRAATDSGDEKCTSFGAVYNVQNGDKVKVIGYGTPLDSGSDDRLSFSGALIKEV